MTSWPKMCVVFHYFRTWKITCLDELSSQGDRFVAVKFRRKTIPLEKLSGSKYFLVFNFLSSKDKLFLWFYESTFLVFITDYALTVEYWENDFWFNYRSSKIVFKLKTKLISHYISEKVVFKKKVLSQVLKIDITSVLSVKHGNIKWKSNEMSGSVRWV